MKRLVGCLVGMLGLCAAGAVYDASTGYVTLQVSGSTPNDSPLNWQQANDSSGKPFWSDGQALHAGANYYLKMFARTIYGGQVKEDGVSVQTLVLPANRIVLDSQFNLKTYRPYRLVFANEGLVCLGNSALLVNDGTLEPFILDGTITLQETTQSRPLYLRPWNIADGQTIQIDAKVRSTASTDYISVSRDSQFYGNVKLLGDMTEFDGWVNISSNRVYLGASGLPSANAVLSLNDAAEACFEAASGSEIPVARLDLNSRATLRVPATNNVAVAGLRLEAGTTLVFEPGADADLGRLSATRLDLPAAGTVKVRMTGSLEAFRRATSRVALTAPAGALDAAKFEVEAGSALGGIPSEMSLAVETVDGKDRLVLSWPPVVEQIVTIPNAGSEGLFNQTKTWSNGKLPKDSGGCDFYSPSGMAIYLPTALSPWTFPGKSLTKDGGTMTVQAARTVTISNLYVKAGTTIRTWPGGDNNVISPLSFYGASAKTAFTFGNQTALEWRGPISGATKLDVHIRQFGADVNDWAPCFFRPAGDNSAFTGTWQVRLLSTTLGTKATKPFTSWEDYYMGLVVGRQANLGGPLAVFAYDALTLQDWQALVARPDEGASAVVLDDPTRGINAVGTVQFQVPEGRSLVVASPLTLAGAIKKKGAGTLALGGAEAPRFCQSARLTAAEVASRGLADTNVLWIAEGGLKPLSKTGVDGLAVRVGPSGALRLDLEPTGDAATYGLYNASWTDPFAAVDATGAADAAATIAVAFDPPAAGVEAKAYTVPVCTVTTAAAAALRGKFAGVKPAKNFAVRFTETADAVADTVTFFATVAPGGLTVLVR